MERRELLQVLASVGLLPLISACSELIPNPKGNGPGIKQPVQAGTLDQLAQNGQFVLANVATDTSPSYPVVVTALSSASPPAGALAHPTVAGLYLLAFSRVCTHQGTTIDAPAGGIMHCSNHGQDFDCKTGAPVGLAQKTSTSLAQLTLELRASNQVWITGFGSGTPTPTPTPPPNPGGTLTLTAPAQVATIAQLTQDGQFVVTTLSTNLNAKHPVIVVAASSASALSGAIPHPSKPGLYLLAFSRVCTHQGTTIDNPAGGKMHCSNHGQDFDTKTGNPTGTANKTTVPLAQFGLEIRNSSEIWAISVLRDGGSGGGGGGGGTLTLNQPAKVATLAQVAADGQFVVGTLSTNLNTTHPVVVVAAKSASALSGAIAHPTVSGLYLLAFSRVCTHAGTTINPPGSGLMHCPNHGQDFDYKTGNPSGTANKTTVPLAQFGLEIRNGTEIWAVSVVRDGGSGGGGGDDD